MPILGQKKKKLQRASSLRPGPTFTGWLLATLKDRRVLLRLLLGAAAVIGMLVVCEAWKEPFRYRGGDRPDGGVTAVVAFQRLNRFRTSRAEVESDLLVNPVFEHDPAKLASLPARFRNALRDIEQAETLDRVPQTTREAFGLITAAGGDRTDFGPMPGRPIHLFSTLKASVTREDGTAGDRLDVILNEFNRFIAPLRRTGRAELDDFRRNKIPEDRPITIIRVDRPEAEGLVVLPADVLMPEMLKETGILGKQSESFPELSPIRMLVRRWLQTQTPPSLRYSSERTQQARLQRRQEVKPEYDEYNPGNTLVAPGNVIDEEALSVLQAEYDAMQSEMPLDKRIFRLFCVSAMFTILAILCGQYLSRNAKSLVRHAGRLGIYLLSLVVAVFLARLLSFDPWRAEIVPILAMVMVFAVAYDQRLATLTAFILSLVISYATSGTMSQFLTLMCASSVAILPLGRIDSRLTIVKVGFLTAAAYLAISYVARVAQSQAHPGVWTDGVLLMNCLKGAGWCLVAGYLVAGSLPFIESAFGVVTDISLLEMTDVSHPLLQELVRRAPGTYNHSMTVATLAETAAERIGANGLLIRVGAYFHDIGKMLKAQYFVENMGEGAVNPHNQLAPAMSTLIIIGHVKDGVDLARQHNLPEPLIDFIEQHHGTTLVKFFYHAATQKIEQDRDHRTDAEESQFRYPGPKPQSREAAVMMLADAVEGASRTLSDPTPKRIESLVKDISMQRLLDDQFDECGLTLTEIRQIEDSLVKSLIGIYHGRIRYPDQKVT